MSSESIKRTTGYLFILKVVRLLTTMFSTILTAKLFGVSVEKDVWLLAFGTITAVISFAWGPLNEVFRAKFVHIREKEGLDVAVKGAASLFIFVIVSILAIIGLIFAFRGGISGFMARDLTAEGISLYESLIVILLPLLLINELTNLLSSILNAFGIYYVPEICGTFTGVLYLVLIAVGAPVIGIYSLAAGQYIISIILLVFLLRSASKRKIFSLKDFCGCSIKITVPYLLYALPFFLPYAFGQVNALAEKWLAGLLGIGNVSTLDYSRQLTILLQGVLSGVFMTVMVPLLSSSHAKKDMATFTHCFREHISTIYLIISLSLPILFGAAYPLCEFLFFRGDMTLDDISTIAYLCRMFSVAFLGIMVYVLFGTTMITCEHNKAYATCGIITQIAVLAINFSFVGTIGLTVFPISVGLIHLLTGMYMWRKTPLWNKAIIVRMLEFNFLVLAIAMIVYGLDSIIPIENPLIKLIALFTLECVVLLPFLSLFGIDIKRFIRRSKNNK